jgi:diguanylate cyclase (GGDEF)-like protein
MFTFSGMSNQDLLKKLEEKIKALEFLSELGKAITSTMQPQEVLRTMLKKTSDLLQPAIWSLTLLDEATNQLKYEILINDPSVDRDKPVELGEGLHGWVAKYGQAIFASETKVASAPLPQHFSHLGKNDALMIVPMKSKNKVLGTIHLQRSLREKAPYVEEDLKILQTVADYAAIAIENAKNFRKVEELTIRDDLTMLSNARHLHSILDREVNRSQRHQKPFSMIFMDIDHFKKVNDTYGHIHGSELLKEVAEIIHKCIRVVDFGARYGGDEFVVVLPDTNKQEAVIIAERIRETIEKNNFLERGGLSIHFTASLGVATFPQDAETKDDLIKMADHAMYDSKKTSRNRVTFAQKP